MEQQRMSEERRYGSTYFACAMGSITQAVISSVTPVLFVCFMELYGFGVWQLGLLCGVNFASQLCADLVLTTLIENVSHRKLVISALLLAAIGLVMFGALPYIPQLTGAGAMFACMIAATVTFSFAGGMLEVMVSPITDAVPRKGGKVNPLLLIHSCYAFGQVGVVVATALFVHFAGYGMWQVIVLIFTALPLAAAAVFAFCPIEEKHTPVIEQPLEAGKKPRRSRFTPVLVISLVAIFMGGGTEMVMNEYVSPMATLALGLDKVTSDVAGMAMFALLLGVGRLLYGIIGDRIDVFVLLVVAGAASCACYLFAGLCPLPIPALVACVVCGLTASVLWPCTLVAAGKTTGGAWMFAVLAVAGDIGDAVLTSAAGFVAEHVGLRTTLALFALAPLIATMCYVMMLLRVRKSRINNIPEEK